PRPFSLRSDKRRAQRELRACKGAETSLPFRGSRSEPASRSTRVLADSPGDRRESACQKSMTSRAASGLAPAAEHEPTGCEAEAEIPRPTAQAISARAPATDGLNRWRPTDEQAAAARVLRSARTCLLLVPGTPGTTYLACRRLARAR